MTVRAVPLGRATQGAGNRPDGLPAAPSEAGVGVYMATSGPRFDSVTGVSRTAMGAVREHLRTVIDLWDTESGGAEAIAAEVSRVAARTRVVHLWGADDGELAVLLGDMLGIDEPAARAMVERSC